MTIRIVRLGTPRLPDEGPRLGTVRHPPRGVSKADYSARLLAWLRSGDPTGHRWTVFTRRYRKEMTNPTSHRLIALLAALSSDSQFSVGCYCEDLRRCHRSILRLLLLEAGATVE